MTFDARERRIVGCVMRGMNNTEIGEELHTSKFMVKKRIGEIFDKTGMNTRLELALWCLSHQTLVSLEN